MGNQPYLTEKETFKINDNIAIGINAINRYRFACGKWNKLFSMTRAGAIITAIQKKLKCDKLEASEIFKENAKRGDYTWNANILKSLFILWKRKKAEKKRHPKDMKDKNFTSQKFF